MTPDGASMDAALEEDQDLFEMANLYPRTTGLPVTVWVSPRGGARHDIHIKVARGPGDRMEIADAAIVSVRPEAALLHGELRSEIARPVYEWVRLNTDALVAYWNGELDTVELAAQLVRHGG